MKKTIVLCAILFLVVVTGIVFAANYAFNHCDSFRMLFSGSSGTAAAAVLGKINPGEGQTLAMREELAGRVAMFLFVGVSILQFIAFFVAAAVFSTLRKNIQMSVSLKLKQLENAEIFLDVPLYIGLFGTVSSFLVMTFSPTSSRLIAYSSTLIGIIFSLVLRLALNYPLRKKLLTARDEE